MDKRSCAPADSTKLGAPVADGGRERCDVLRQLSAEHRGRADGDAAHRAQPGRRRAVAQQRRQYRCHAACFYTQARQVLCI